MDGVSLLAEARGAGLVVRLGDDDTLIVEGRRDLNDMAMRVLGSKPEVVQVLLDQAKHVDDACERCFACSVRLIPSYWGPRLCSPCCQVVTQEFDRTEWPEVAPVW